MLFLLQREVVKIGSSRNKYYNMATKNLYDLTSEASVESLLNPFIRYVSGAAKYA